MPSEEDSDSDVQQGATWEHQSLAQVWSKQTLSMTNHGFCLSRSVRHYSMDNFW